MGADLTEILARVEAASGPSRGLFYDVAEAAMPDYRDALDWRADFNSFLAVGAWTDAALALCERVLPGWLPYFQKRRGLGEPPTGMSVADISGRPGWEGWTATVLLTAGEYHPASAPTAPLALLASMLRALIASPTASELGAQVEGERS